MNTTTDGCAYTVPATATATTATTATATTATTATATTATATTACAKAGGRSKKRRVRPTAHTAAIKTVLWNIFDAEITNPEKKVVPLECIYGSGTREFCERCAQGLAFSDEGFLTCTNNRCGIIYRDQVDQTAEWRYYGADDNHGADPTRCGMPINPLLQESSYGCKVLCFGGAMSYEMRKIRRYTEWQSMPYKEKSQYDEFQVITTMAHNAGIPKMIIDDAICYHKKISDSPETFRGENRDSIIASSIYLACRSNHYPRTAKEIALIFHLNESSATKGCKNAMTILNELEKDLQNKDKTNFGKTKPEAFIERYCSRLNINQELTKLCKFISMKLEDMHAMPENTPPSIAAGVVYFVANACRGHVSKTDIRGVSSISEVTINKCFRKLDHLAKSGTLVPAAICRKYGLAQYLPPVAAQATLPAPPHASAAATG